MKKPVSGLRNSLHLNYVLADAGAELAIASPKGGQPPVDPKSESPDLKPLLLKDFMVIMT